MNCLSLPKRQQGSVLIMALLVVVLVVAFTLKASRDYQLSMARAEARWHGAQARAYLSGAERLAVFFLEQDDPAIDTLMEDWAQPIPPFPIEGGALMAEIQDASTRLNLNDLATPFVPEKAMDSHERFSESQRRFLRLLQSFEFYPLALEDAIAILEAIVDWTDADSEPAGFFGAEADYYQSLDSPYLPANAPFTSVDELRLVRGMTPQLMLLLRPYLSALPAGSAPMNVNTLPDQLLRSFNASASLTPLHPEDIGLLRQEMLEYVTIEDFSSNPVWDSIIAEPGGVNVDNTDIKTGLFRVTTYVSLGEQRRGMESLLQRQGEGDAVDITVISRRDIYDFIPTDQTQSGEGYNR